ncbi:MAG: hypothetical protein ACQETW_05310 [Pseudomonadota bacterium]
MNTPRKTVLITALCALGLAHLPVWADKDDEVREAAQEATTVIANRPGMEHKVKREVRVGLAGCLPSDIGWAASTVFPFPMARTGVTLTLKRR